MTITNPANANLALAHDATGEARQALSSLTLGAVAPESYPGRLRSQDRLTGLARGAFDKAQPLAATIADSARADIDALRRSELQADPFATACLAGASLSVRALPVPLGAEDVKHVIASTMDQTLVTACHDVDLDTIKKLKTHKGVERRRRRLKAEIDTFVQKLLPVLARQIAGHIRDELAEELDRRYENCRRAQHALRRFVAEAADPGEEIPGSHRFSCGPRLGVVLKAAAVNRPDMIDRDGMPTEAIWSAFGAHVASEALTAMEDPQEAINALRQFLESAVTGALDGLTLDGLYAITQEQPEIPAWIAKTAARLQVAASAPDPYRVRLAQVPTAMSDALYDQVLNHIQTATRSREPNRLQLVELTYAFRADEVLGADPRGLHRVLASILPHASNPELANALSIRRAGLAGPGTRQGGVDRASADGRSSAVPRLGPEEGPQRGW